MEWLRLGCELYNLIHMEQLLFIKKLGWDGCCIFLFLQIACAFGKHQNFSYPVSTQVVRLTISILIMMEYLFSGVTCVFQMSQMCFPNVSCTDQTQLRSLMPM